MSTIRPARITKVLSDSIAAEIGFDAGDAIVSINGTNVCDRRNRFFIACRKLLNASGR